MPLAELLPADPGRLMAAAAVAAGYVGLCGGAALARLRSRPGREAAAADPGTVTVAHASQTGLAEAIAHRTARAMSEAGVPCRVAPLSALDRPRLEAGGRILLILSTTGEGDAPDAAAGFARRVLGSEADLARLHYGVLALGDRTYRRFCAFGLAVADWLQRSGARALFPPITVDDGDPDALGRWQEALTAAGIAGSGPEERPWIAAEPFLPWYLVERRTLNPADSEHAAFQLAFRPAGGMPGWQAGDLARLRVPGDPPCHRDYSIASVPDEGRLVLLVRQARHPGGTLGRGSGWLTETLSEGGSALLQIRRNPGFHAPAGDPPMILIGNGTGLAGLRAHLVARAARGIGGAWLLFGERRRAADWFWREEIEGWAAAGIVDRLDLAFSRDQPERVYVQHRLRAAAADLAARVEAGAAILVCGSAEGMAPAVHAVLADVLGPERLERMAEEGRYRRDVY